MVGITSQSHPVRPEDQLTPKKAMRHAWRWWTIMLVAPFLLSLVVLERFVFGTVGNEDAAAKTYWFLICMAYLVTVVPATIFWRSHVFKAYWHGDVVDPHSYLSGMLIVWAALEIGGFLSLIGCLVSNSLLPNLLPAAVAFFVFATLWPNGHAMTRHVGDKDDPEAYEEPR